MQAQVEISPAVTRQQHYDDLMACSDSSANSVWLAQIIASWLVGEGALPDRLGLDENPFRQLLNQHFSGHALTYQAPSGKIRISAACWKSRISSNC